MRDSKIAAILRDFETDTTDRASARAPLGDGETTKVLQGVIPRRQATLDVSRDRESASGVGDKLLERVAILREQEPEQGIERFARIAAESEQRENFGRYVKGAPGRPINLPRHGACAFDEEPIALMG